MTLTGVHHVQITIPPGEETSARVFYCQLLGLTEIEKPTALKSNGGFWLQSGNIQIHVGTETGVDRNKSKAHIAYEVEDIEWWRNKLKQVNTTILESQAIPGCKRFEFRDPFGNRVELIQLI